MEQLKALRDIFESGFINEDEYETRKAQIIDKLTSTTLQPSKIAPKLPPKRRSLMHSTETDTGDGVPNADPEIGSQSSQQQREPKDKEEINPRRINCNNNSIPMVSHVELPALVSNPNPIPNLILTDAELDQQKASEAPSPVVSSPLTRKDFPLQQRQDLAKVISNMKNLAYLDHIIQLLSFNAPHLLTYDEVNNEYSFDLNQFDNETLAIVDDYIQEIVKQSDSQKSENESKPLEEEPSLQFLKENDDLFDIERRENSIEISLESFLEDSFEKDDMFHRILMEGEEPGSHNVVATTLLDSQLPTLELNEEPASKRKASKSISLSSSSECIDVMDEENQERNDVDDDENDEDFQDDEEDGDDDDDFKANGDDDEYNSDEDYVSSSHRTKRRKSQHSTTPSEIFPNSSVSNVVTELPAPAGVDTTAEPPKKFKIKVHIHKIKKTAHSAKPWQCESCSKSFADRSNLVKHMRSHTKERPYVCPFSGCGKSYSHKATLKDHLFTHNGTRPYRCEFEGCGKSFSQNSNLRRHKRIHTGDKPYVCSVCGRAFNQSSNLNQHIAGHNSGKF